MRWKICPCQHWPIYLANGQLSPQLGTTQISVKSTAIYPYFGRKINGNKSQSWDKILMLQILQRFVLYPAMMVSNHNLDRLANAGKCMFSTLLLYFLLICYVRNAIVIRHLVQHEVNYRTLQLLQHYSYNTRDCAS